MTAPALPRTDLQAEADRADTAYTQAIQDAVRTHNWYGVPAAAHAYKQARAALKETEEDA
jgi:hypothetical protein